MEATLIDPIVTIYCVDCKKNNIKKEATYINTKTREPLCYQHWKDRKNVHNGAVDNFITDSQLSTVGTTTRTKRARVSRSNKVKK